MKLRGEKGRETATWGWKCMNRERQRDLRKRNTIKGMERDEREN